MQIQRYLSILHLCTILLFGICGYSQNLNEVKKWYFGNLAGLDFMTSPPTTLTGSMNAMEGCSSVADVNGNLLFYTDGLTIWNSSHLPMANGTGLTGNANSWSVQGALIVRNPTLTYIFYVFYLAPVASINGMKYAIVDMSLAAGQGSVTSKNIQLQTPTCEKMTAVRHCNGSDIWVVTHDYGNNNFRSYLVTSAGITGTVVSGVGTSLNIAVASSGSMKISPDGKRLASTTHSIVGGAIFELFDFDASSGAVSNPYVLGTSQDRGYGCEFSPDGTKVYATTFSLGSFSNNTIFQWDLCAASPASSVAPFASSGAGNLQIGPDKKLYVVKAGQPMLGVFSNPNLPGIASNYNDNAISLALNTNNSLCLPNFITSYFLSPPSYNFLHNIAQGYPCPAMSFSLPPPSCVNNATPLSVSWNFGDPVSNNNTSTLSNPTHTYSGVGSYTVTLALTYNCRTDTIRDVIQVLQPCINLVTNSVTCANLGSGTVSCSGGIGPYSYTWTPTLQTGSVATGLAPGSYTINVYDSGTAYTSSVTTFINPLIPLTGSISVTPNLSCNGDLNGTGQVIGLAGGSSTQFYLWSNGTQIRTVSTPTGMTAGSWTVTITDALTSCQIYSVLTISQPPPLILNLSSNTPTTCAGSSITLTGTNSGGTPGYTYSWTNSPPTNTISVSENIAGNYVYTLQSTDANNCLSSNTISLNFIANPVLTVQDVSICPLKFGTLTASGANTYTWTLSSTTLGLTGPTLTDNPLSDSQYTVVGSALGCTSVATASIILYPSPVPIIQSNSPRCEGTSLDVNASGGSIYQWSGPVSFNSNLPFNTIPNLALNHGGPYNLTVTSVNGCTAATSATLTVNPIPTVSAAGSTVCTSQTLSLFANSAGSSFVWNGPMNFISSVQNPTLANPVLARTGTYTVKATSVPGCTNSAVTTVSVTTPPSLSVALSSGSLCSQAFNGSPNIIVLTASGGNSYTLFTPNLIGASTPVSPSASLIAVPPYAASVTLGTATLQGSNGVCDNQSTFVFTVVPNPTVGVNSYTPVICAGQNFTYTSNGANSYVWTATSPNYTTYSNGGVAVAHPSINAVFSVYGSSLGCNSALQTSSITVNPIPTLTLSAASNSICLYENTKLSVAGTGTSFTWSPATGLSNTTNSAVVASPQVSQGYTVLVSVANCTNAANLYLTVLPLPKPMIDFVTPAVCLNDKISLKGSGGVLYEWHGPDHLFIQGQNPVFEALSSSYSGNYTLTVTDINGCKSSTVTTVEILPAPSGYLSNFKEEACAPYCTNFNFNSSDKNKTVKSSWMINDQFLNGNTFSYCFSSSGSYTINGTIFDETTNCKNTTSYLLIVHPKPKADFVFSPKQPIEGQEEVLFTNNSAGDGNLSFNWYFNDNKGYSITQKNTSYLYNEPGEYRVVLVSKNDWKCADTIIKIIKVESDFALYIPNAFTPNGDDRNDIFLPVVRSVKKYDLKIFDRWGKMIFQTVDPNQGWDGTYNGILCKQDVYVWKIHVVSLDGKEKFETGNVTSLPSD